MWAHVVPTHCSFCDVKVKFDTPYGFLLRLLVVMTCESDLVFQGVWNNFQWIKLIGCDASQAETTLLFTSLWCLSRPVNHTLFFFFELPVFTLISQKTDQLQTWCACVPQFGNKDRKGGSGEFSTQGQLRDPLGSPNTVAVWVSSGSLPRFALVHAPPSWWQVLVSKSEDV